MKSSFPTRSLMVFLLSTCCLPRLVAQSQLDVSQCFKQLLQQRRGSKSYGKLELAFLSRISEANYERTAHDASQTFPGLASADYASFRKDRSELFQGLQLSPDYYESVALSSTVLDSDGKSVMQSCINTEAARQFGLHYLASADDGSSASLQFFWKPMTEKRQIKVSGSILVNAEVVGTKVKKGRLFPSGTRISSDGPTIILRRIDPEKPILATVVTKSPLGTIGPIAIQPFPTEPTLETRYREQVATETFIDSRISRGVATTGQGHKFTAIKEVNGAILGINCSWPPAIDRHTFETCGPLGTELTQALCDGSTTDESPYALTMTVVYSEPYMVCTENCGDVLKGNNAQQAQINSRFELFRNTGIVPRLPLLDPPSSSANKEACSWQNGSSLYHHLN